MVFYKVYGYCIQDECGIMEFRGHKEFRYTIPRVQPMHLSSRVAIVQLTCIYHDATNQTVRIVMFPYICHEITRVQGHCIRLNCFPLKYMNRHNTTHVQECDFEHGIFYKYW